MSTPLPTFDELIDNPHQLGRVHQLAQRGDRDAQVLVDRMTNAWADVVRDLDTDDFGGTAA